jgi:hypothetical protein
MRANWRLQAHRCVLGHVASCPSSNTKRFTLQVQDTCDLVLAFKFMFEGEYKVTGVLHLQRVLFWIW